jgi:hypothetical protein
VLSPPRVTLRIAGRQDLLELVIDVVKDRVGAQQWFDYWTERLYRVCAGAELDERIPVEFGALIAGTGIVRQMGQRQ